MNSLFYEISYIS